VNCILINSKVHDVGCFPGVLLPITDYSLLVVSPGLLMNLKADKTGAKLKAHKTKITSKNHYET